MKSYRSLETIGPWFNWTLLSIDLSAIGQLRDWTVELLIQAIFSQIARWRPLVHSPTGLYRALTYSALANCEFGLFDHRSSNSFTIASGKVPSHRATQLSKASSKTHFQLVQRGSLPYKLVFTDPLKNVIAGTKKVLLTSKNHSRDLASGDHLWWKRDL